MSIYRKNYNIYLKKTFDENFFVYILIHNVAI